MITSITLAATVFFVVPGGSVEAQPPAAEHRILTQEGSPLSILAYEARYQPRRSSQREAIRHEVNYRNTSGQKIVAVQFGLLSFNIFNEFQDRLGGFAIEDIDVLGIESGTWLASALAEAAFYTGVVYVDKVRFEDGEIWIADEDEILEQLREIEEGFDAAALGR